MTGATRSRRSTRPITQLVAVIARMPDSQLFDLTNDPRVDAESADNRFSWWSGIQHDIYHLGQIALLKKAV